MDRTAGRDRRRCDCPGCPRPTGRRQERVLALAAPGQRHRAAKGAGCQDGDVEVLSSRILLRPADLGRSRHFYRDVLGLAVYRESGSPGDPGVVFFLGSGFLEVSGHSQALPGTR